MYVNTPKAAGKSGEAKQRKILKTLVITVPTGPAPAGFAGYSVSSANHAAENTQCFPQCGINRCSCGQSLIRDLRALAEIIPECSIGGRVVVRVTTAGVSTPFRLSQG